MGEEASENIPDGYSLFSMHSLEYLRLFTDNGDRV
jgi:hypothetical protein